MATTAKPTTSSSRRSLSARMTAKVGPLPVWAWALLILVAGYLVYRLTAGKSSTSSNSTDTTSSTAPDTAGSVTGDTGNPPASGQGTPADNLSSDVLSQLSSLSGNVDALTGLVQSSPAFWPNSGDSGSGSAVPNTGSTGSSVPAAPAKVTAPATVKKPAAAPPAPAKVRYYTYAPGKAPKGRAKDAAPAKGPAGTTLHFARGKGYYYA